ncbi:alpha/beta fold hydrolase [Luteimonas viscosa]|uniref:Alpha/beta fold hydrolase n=1 Tax=Luteimonas viscosa TaxID=1132694 RepID=A0A5D4XQ51_9GAMM|nr:alpha/beta hydrolase [Luteimonas viscosa]TYT24850.1 alpha/beta fold hydrolase [Luteimonas viscosa]
MRRTGKMALLVLAASALALVLVLGAYRRDMRRAHIAVEGAAVALTSAGPIEYSEAGEGVPVLSIHGAGGGWDQGLANVAGVFDAGFRVIAPSRFGYLGTPLPGEASVSAQADAHAALLSSLAVDRAVVVGVSAGARSALELALRHPDRVSALVLIVPGTYAPDNPVAIEDSRGSALAFRLVSAGADFAWWAVEKTAPSTLVRFLGVDPALLDAATPQEREAVFDVVHSVQPLSRRVAGINLDSTPDTVRPPLERIAVPTLIVTARDDLFNTLPAAEFAARTVPDAELVVFDTGGHLLVGHGVELKRAVLGFLKRVEVEDDAGHEPGFAGQPSPE